MKLFGHFDSWRVDHDAERAALRLLRDRPGVPVPELRAGGQLYPDPEPWPYLVSSRIPGRSLRELPLAAPELHRVAFALGAVLRRVHETPARAGGPLQRDPVRDHGAGWRRRCRDGGALPAALVDSYPDRYEVDPVRRLVHGDLTPEHIFVDGSGALTGIIDWGDATVTDPYYELGPLHLGALRADRAALRAFLAGYGWRVGADFVPRAMGAALRHAFNLFGDLPDRLRPDRYDSLDSFATALWDPHLP